MENEKLNLQIGDVVEHHLRGIVTAVERWGYSVTCIDMHAPKAEPLNWSIEDDSDDWHSLMTEESE